MEFRYGAVDELPPPLPPPPYRDPTTSSWGYSYFTQQAIRAGHRIPSSKRAIEYFNSGPGWANDCFNAGFGQVNVYTRNPLDVHEAIQRELEKERIREEIIAAEIARRQSLEAEVGREMMIETELALRARRGQVDAFDRFSFPFGGGMEFEPRDVSFLHNKGLSSEETIAMSLEERLGMRERSETGRLVTVPFHHGSIEPKIKEVMSPPADVKKDKDKIVILAEPDASLSGAKQEVVPPEEVGVSDLSGGVSKEKVEEEWSCELCQVSVTTECGLNDHIQGNKHKSRAGALRAQVNGNNIGIGTFPRKDIDPSVEITHKIGSDMGLQAGGELPQFRESSLQINSSTERIKENNVSILEESDKTDNTRKENLGVQKAPGKELKEKKVYTFWREICQVGAHNENVMEAHRKGKKHVSRLQEAEENDTTNRTPQNAGIQVVNDAEESTIEGNNINHKEADVAKPDAALSGAKQKAVPPEEEGASDLSGGVSKEKVEEEWSCELCQVSVTTERGLNDHIQGKKHKSRAGALRAWVNGNNIGTFPRKDIDPSVEITHKIGSDMGLKAGGELSQFRESSLQIDSSTERIKENNVSILEESDKTDNTRKENLGVQKAPRKELKEKKVCTFWREVCQVGAHNENVMEAHRKGKKHVSRLQEAEENDTTNRTPQNAGIQAVNDAEESTIEGNNINHKEADAAKPDAALSGAKQKAVPLEEEGASDLSGGVSKDKVEEEWSCELCQVSVTTERGLNDHIQGKKHKSRAGALRAWVNGNNMGTFPRKDIDLSVEITHKIGSDMGLKAGGELLQFRESSLQIDSSTERIKENNVSILEESDKTDNTRKENLGVQKAPRKELKKKKVCTFWREVCQVGAHNENVMEAHKKGKKHLSRLQESEENDTTNRTPQNAGIQAVNDAEEATIESNNINDKETGVAKPDAALSGAKQKAVPPGASDLSGGVSKEKVEEEWSCELCQVSVTTERGLNDHIQGKKYKSRAGASSAQVNGNNIGIGTFPRKDFDPSVEITHKIGSDMGLKSGGELLQFRESSLPINSSTERIKENNVSILEESDKTDNTRKENLGVQKAPWKELKEKKVYTFWREICQVGAHNENAMEAHRKGKKHVSQLQKAEENDTTNRTPQNACIQAVNDAEESTIEGNDINHKEAGVAKPDAALSGAKQKVVPPEEEGASDLSGGVSEKKVNEEWSCELCPVSATTERGLNDHIQGKKHKSRAGALTAQMNGNNIGIGTFPWKDIAPSVEITHKSGSDMGLKSRGELLQFRESSLQINSSAERIKENNVSILEESDKTDNTRKENLGVQKAPWKGIKEKKVYTFWREICQVGAHNENVMEANRKGKKHGSRLQEAEENDTTNQTPQNAGFQAGSDAEEFTIEANNINNKEADVAKPDAALSGAKQKAVPPEEEGASDLSGGVSEKKVKEEWSCELCPVSATTERGLNDHIQGKKHKSRAGALTAQMNGNNIGIGTFPWKDIDPSVEITHKSGSEMGLKSRGELLQFRESSLQINSSTALIKENNVSILEESDKTDHARKENLGVQKAPKKVQKEKKVYTFWREMCQVGADNENMMEAHRMGKKQRKWKKHMTWLQKAEKSDTTS